MVTLKDGTTFKTPNEKEIVPFKTRFKTHQPRTFAFETTGESMTQQQFKEECDVNNILAKYRKTGLVTHLSKHQGKFGDFSSLEDYQTSIGKIQEAQQSFLQLPSELRSKFENDPAKLIEFLSDANNDEEAVKYGLKIKIQKEVSLEEAMTNALEKNDAKRQKNDKKEK